jgi:DNA topoisomerase-1
MEDDLDAISLGKLSREKYLNHFYFDTGSSGGLERKLNQEFNKDSSRLIKQFGENIDLRIGRYGIYVEKDDQRATVFDTIAPSDLDVIEIENIFKKKNSASPSLGKFPNTDDDIFLKNGRFGPYIQMGDKMKSLPPNLNEDDINLDLAIQIISLPKNLGSMSNSEETILVDIGRYGPYVKSGKTFKSIPKNLNLLNITLEEAIELLSSKTTSSSILKTLGQDDAKNDIVIKNGRYGKFITNGIVNAPMPKGITENELQLDEAIKILSTRKPKKFKKRR